MTGVGCQDLSTASGIEHNALISRLRLLESRSARYAIYLTPPPDDPLAVQAEAWLGRSAFPQGERMGPAGAAAPEAANIDDPRRYGFHATLRAPFRLAEGADEAILRSTFDAFCDVADVPSPQLRIDRLGPFFALVAQDHAPLAKLAAKTVRYFDELRAPVTADDRKRRNADGLDARGRALLEAYGYPHVLERFTFHMTLSGKVHEKDAADVLSAAEDHFSGALGHPQRLVLAVFREREPGAPFEAIRLSPSSPHGPGAMGKRFAARDRDR